MGHTPGPWSADYGGFAVFCDTGAEVAVVTTGNHDDGSAVAMPEMESNLNLISAAPDLLEACELLLIYLGDWNDMEDETCAAARRAIAKAKGQEVPNG